MERNRQEPESAAMGLLARRLIRAADQLSLVIKDMDDLGWSMDSYSRQHLRDVAFCLQESAYRITALHGDPELPRACAGTDHENRADPPGADRLTG